MDVELVRAQDRVRVGPEPEERDVAEVEETAPADHDVEAEREQRVQDRVVRDCIDVAAVAEDRHERHRAHESEQLGPPRDPVEHLLRARALDVLRRARDPFVLADLRALLAHGTYTFLMSGRPRMP